MTCDVGTLPLGARMEPLSAATNALSSGSGTIGLGSETWVLLAHYGVNHEAQLVSDFFSISSNKGIGSNVTSCPIL
jgi:hypothetical protein